MSSVVNHIHNEKFVFSGRLSEYEPIENIILSKNLFTWVWVDCFSKFTLNKNDFKIIKKLNKKICITSPDLLGREDEIEYFANIILKNKIFPDAICTKFKNIKIWEKHLNITY